MPPRVYEWVKDPQLAQNLDVLKLRLRVVNDTGGDCDVRLYVKRGDVWSLEDEQTVGTGVSLVTLTAYMGWEPVTVEPLESGEYVLDSGQELDVEPEGCTAYEVVEGEVSVETEAGPYISSEAWVACDPFTVVSAKGARVRWYRVPAEDVLRRTEVRITACDDVVYEGVVEDARPFFVAQGGGGGGVSCTPTEVTVAPGEAFKVTVTTGCSGELVVKRGGETVYVDTVGEGEHELYLTAPDAVGVYEYTVEACDASCGFTVRVESAEARGGGGGGAQEGGAAPALDERTAELVKSYTVVSVDIIKVMQVGLP